MDISDSRPVLKVVQKEKSVQRVVLKRFKSLYFEGKSVQFRLRIFLQETLVGSKLIYTGSLVSLFNLFIQPFVYESKHSSTIFRFLEFTFKMVNFIVRLSQFVFVLNPYCFYILCTSVVFGIAATGEVSVRLGLFDFNLKSHGLSTGRVKTGLHLCYK